MNIKSRVVAVVTTVALSGVAAIVPLVAVADHTTAHTIETLTAQIAALQVQLLALSAGSAAPVAGKCSFTRSLTVGARGDDVTCLQNYLKGTGHFTYAGGATGYFGGVSKTAVAAWQSANSVSPAAGYFGTLSRAKYDSMVAGAPAAPVAPGAPAAPVVVVAAGSGLTVTAAAAQPQSQLAPESAARLPMVKMVLTASADGDVTVKSVTIERKGLGDNAVFDGVVLINDDDTQVGTSKTFGSDNKAVLSDSLTVKAGTSKTVTISANMAAALDNYAGQTPRFAVVAMDAGTSKVNASFPIEGNSMTVNGTLAIGSVTMSIGALDPGAANTKNVGTTGYYLASVKASVGSAEDVTFEQVRFNQAGSAGSGDLKNVMVKVGDKEYVAAISSDGKYYTAKFDGGLKVEKGKNLDFSVKADLMDGVDRTVDMNVLRKTDIVVKGDTFGYHIIPTGGSSGTAGAGAFSSNQEPFFNAYAATVGGGSFQVNASTKVPSSNVPVDVSDTIIGGFLIDVKGEEAKVSAFTLNFTFTGTGTSSDVTSVKLMKEDGGIVAGPKDPSSGVVSWTDSWTAAKGENHYFVKAKLDTSFVTNDTVRVSVDPNDQITVKGVTTGLTITAIPSTLVTANTQTVRAAAVRVSVSELPISQNVVRGVSGYHFATYTFDSTSSGEDVRVTSVQLRDTIDAAGSGDEVNSCVLYDGATALNTGSDVSNPSDPTGTTNDITFTLTNNLIIPKGSVKRVDLKCNISSGAANASTHQWGTNAAAANISSTGKDTGQAITESITTGTGQLMTVRTAGSYTVTKDASAPAAALVIAGKTDVPVNVLRFSATDEAINITEVTLNFSTSTASTSDFLKASVWDGATKIGEAVFTQTDPALASSSKATSTLTAAFVVPKDGSRLLTVKADFAPISVTATSSAGRLLAIDYDGVSSTTGIGQSSGQRLGSSSSKNTAGASFKIVKSVPTVTKIAVPSTSLPQTNGVLYRFSVKADPSGPVALYKFTFTIGSSSKSATTSNMNIYGYSDSGFSVKAYDNNPLHPNNNECVGWANLSNHPSNCTTLQVQAPFVTTASTSIASTGSAGTGDAIFFFAPVANNASSTEAISVPAGDTRYFELRGDLRLTTSGDTGNSISVELAGDANNMAQSAITGAAQPVLEGGDLEGAGQHILRDPPTTTATGGAVNTCGGGDCANYGVLAYGPDRARGKMATAILAAMRNTDNNFIWSPVSTTTSTSTPDWTNGFSVPGLPGTNLSPNTFTN